MKVKYVVRKSGSSGWYTISTKVCCDSGTGFDFYETVYIHVIKTKSELDSQVNFIKKDGGMVVYADMKEGVVA